MEASSYSENGHAVGKNLHKSAEPHCSKRMRCELQKNNNLDTEHSVDERLWKIFEREINKEIEERMTNLETIEKRIGQCHNDLHLLRKGIVKKYYENTYKKCTGRVQHKIHPAVSKLIGKRPRQSTDLVENGDSLAESTLCDRRRTTRFSNVKEKEISKDENEKIVTEKQKVCENKGKLPRYVPPKLPETCNSQDSLRAGNTQKYRIRVCVGNLAKKVDDSIYDKATHKWVLYIRSSIGPLNIEQEVSKVRFFLHPSYKPHDVVTVPSPPFVLHRRGWGEFPVRIRLYFSNPLNKNVDIIHNLQLHGSNWGTFIKSTETVVDLWLHSDHIKKDGEDQSERLSEGTFKLVTKNLKTNITLCNADCLHTNSLDEKCMACKLDDVNFENYKSENESGLGSDSETCSNELNKYLPDEYVADKGNTVQHENNSGMNYPQKGCSFSSDLPSHQVDNMYSSDISEHDHVQDIELENDLDNIINFDLDYSDTDLHKSLLLDNAVETESENIFMTHTSEDKNDLLMNTLLNGDFTKEFHLPHVAQNEACKSKVQIYTTNVDNELKSFSCNNEDKWVKLNYEKDKISPHYVGELEHCEKRNFRIKNEVNKDVNYNSKGGNNFTGVGLNTQNSLKCLDSTEQHTPKMEDFYFKTECKEISCNNSVQENTDLLLNVNGSYISDSSEDKITRNENNRSNEVTFDDQSEIFGDVFNNWVEEIVIESGSSDDYKVHNQCPNTDVLSNEILNGSEGYILPDMYFHSQGEKQFHNGNINFSDYDNLMCNRTGDSKCFETGSEINGMQDINTISDTPTPVNKNMDKFIEEKTINNSLAEQKQDDMTGKDESEDNVMNLINNKSTTVLERDRHLHNIGDRFNDELVKDGALEIDNMKESKGSLLVHSKSSLSNTELALKQSVFKHGGRIFIKNKRTKFKSIPLESKHHPVRILAGSSIGAGSVGSKHIVFLPSKKVLDTNISHCCDVNSSQIGSNSIALPSSAISGVSQILPENRACTTLLNGDKLGLKSNINAISDGVVAPSVLQRNTLPVNSSNNNNTVPVSKLNNFVIVNKNRLQPQIRPGVSQNNRYILLSAADSSKHLVLKKSPVLQSSIVNSSTKHILVSTSAGNTKDGKLIVVKPPGISLLKTKQQQHIAAECPQTVAQKHQPNVLSCIEQTGFRGNKTLLLNKKLSKEIVTETRIAQLYKCRDNLVNNCNFADIEAAVRWLVRGLPLVHVDACFLPFKALHPYCAPDTETFISWPRPKQHAAEWLRAKTVQRILQSRGIQNIWSTKQIMYWSRHHGYCPSYTLQDDIKGEIRNRDNIYTHKLTQYTPATVELDWANSSTESIMETNYIDVVGMNDSSQQTEIPGSKEEIIENEDVIDNSEWGRNFHMLIESSIKQMVCSMKQKVLEGRLVRSGVAQLLISQSTHILAEDLLRRSLAAAHHREGTAVELEDTHAALLSRPEFDLFTNQGFGVID